VISTKHNERDNVGKIMSKVEAFGFSLQLTVEWMVTHAVSTSWTARILHNYEELGSVDAIGQQCASRNPPKSKLLRRGLFRNMIGFAHLNSVNAR
jgi:hypothetical protein